MAPASPGTTASPRSGSSGRAGAGRTGNPAVPAAGGREPSAGELREFRGRLLDAGWTERMLRDHLRTTDPYRRETAEQIVRRAYRDVLGREADESGLRTYRRNVLDRGWTESDVRDDLRKSAEYRNRPRH